MAENKIFAHTPEEVEALINKEGIEYVSVRFTDLIGVQQHFTVSASEFIDNAFTDGMPFDGSSVQGFQAINESDMKLIPDVTTAFVDPFRKHKTLDVAFSIVDPLTDEPYSRDPRQVAGKAEAYLKSTAIADTASFPARTASHPPAHDRVRRGRRQVHGCRQLVGAPCPRPIRRAREPR